MPADAGRRVEQFTELIATAIANTEARVELARLADEQAALRRVATLVAEEAPARGAVREGRRGGGGHASASRSTPRSSGSSRTRRRRSSRCGASSRRAASASACGCRSTAAASPRRCSASAARCVSTTTPPRTARSPSTPGKHGITSAVGCPIFVKGRVWGAMVVAHTGSEPFPADAERRVSQFTDLVATALANAEARAELQRLADEQAALRRVATLVAEAAAAGRGLRRGRSRRWRGSSAHAGRDDACRGRGRVQRSSPTAGRSRGIVHVGMRLPLVGDSVTARVLRTGGRRG